MDSHDCLQRTVVFAHEAIICVVTVLIVTILLIHAATVMIACGASNASVHALLVFAALIVSFAEANSDR